MSTDHDHGRTIEDPTPDTSAKALVNALDLIDRQQTGKPAPMATCPHDGEPLVMTFEFDGAEFICVVCDRLYGFLAPTPAEPTPELEARYDELRAQYLAARAKREHR